MTNLNFIKSLTAGVALAMIACAKTQAHSYPETTCDDANGLQCWTCGTNCKATLYDGGKLVVSGTGELHGGNDYNYSLKSSNSNLPQAVTSVKINEGITNIVGNTFWGVNTIQEIEIADSVTTIGGDVLNPLNQYKLIISENTSITSFDPDWYSMSYVNSVFCRGDAQICRSKLEASNDKFANKTITDEIRDADGNLLEKCSSSGCLKYDTDGKILGGYDFHDNLVAVYNDDGNIIAKYDFEGNQTGIYKYDGAGNLTAVIENGVSTYKKTSYTPAEAAAAIKKGNNNKVTLTFK